MSDMKAAIVPKSDQLNADDLISGPITVKITGVTIKPGEQPVAISFDGDNGKPYKPCKGMCRVMVNAWGADSKHYVGRSMTLFREPTVKWGGLEVGGIQISHMTDIKGPLTMALTATRGSRKPFTVKPLSSSKQTESAGQKSPNPVTEGTGAPASLAQASAPADPDEEPSITDEQDKRVQALLDEHGVPLAEVLAFGGWDDLRKDMPARLFNSVCAWIADKNGVRTNSKSKA